MEIIILFFLWRDYALCCFDCAAVPFVMNADNYEYTHNIVFICLIKCSMQKERKMFS